MGKINSKQTLTALQRLFCHEYVLDLNAMQAAIRAGYSDNYAKAQSYALLENIGIKNFIAELMSARIQRSTYDSDGVLKQLIKEHEADIADLYYEETGTLKPIHEWPKVFRTGLTVEVTSDEQYSGKGEDRILIGYIKRVKFGDRVRRLEMIGNHTNVAAFAPRRAADGPSELDMFAAIYDAIKNRQPLVANVPGIKKP